jgi:hypothetical protein
MTPRSLFNIIIKTIGIFFIRDLLGLIPQFLSGFLYFSGSENNTTAIWILCASAVQIAIYGWMLFILLFKTDWLIERLALDKGFAEERLDINLHRSTVLYLVFVLTGILVIINALPGFCRNVFIYFEQKKLSYDQHPDLSYLILYLVEIIIGLLLLGNAKALVNLIELKRRK